MVILLIATCAYAAWESGLLLQGLKGILVQQMSKTFQAKVSIDRIDIYGNFAIVRGLDIKHRDYSFSSLELILEYDLGKILTRKFDVVGGIRRVTLVRPKISFREMEWVEVKPLVSPSWASFVKIASQIQNTNICLTKGRWELGLMSINDLYFNVDLSKKEANYIPVKLAMRGIFSVPKIEIPLNLKSEIKVADKEIRLKSNFSIGDLPHTGIGVIKGSILDPENPKMLLDLTLNSRKMKFGDISLDALKLAARMKGESGVFQTEGKFDAAKGYVYGQEITGLSFDFRDDTRSFEVKGNADFARGRFRLTRGIYKKEKKPLFEGDAGFSFEDYEIPLSFLYSGEDLNIKKISFEQGGEILLDGVGVGKLTKRRLSLSLKFERGKYAVDSRIAGISLGLDFPFAENLEKKLNISLGTGSKIDAIFKIAKNEIPLKLKAILEKLYIMDREISGNVDFNGKLKFKKTFLVDGEIGVNSLFFKSGKPGEKNIPGITSSIFRIKYDREQVFLYPRLINGKEVRGEVKFQKDKCALNVLYLFEPPISIQGEIAYSSKSIDFSGLKINNIEVNGNVALQDRSLNLSVRIDNENPLLFTNLASVFISGLKDFKPEEGAGVQGFIQVTGLVDKPCIQGNIEYTGKVINSAKIEGLKYEGETLVFTLGMKWGESSLSADALIMLNKEKIDAGLKGDLNLIVGKKENPAISVNAPFYLRGEVKNVQTSPQFLCEFGFSDPMINKKLGRSVKVNLKYSEGVLEFLPVSSQLDYFPVGKITFEEKLIKILNFSLCRGEVQTLVINGQIIPDEQNIDLTVDVNEEMNNIAIFFPQDIKKANGNILTNLHIQGDFHDPVLTGRCRVVNGEVVFAGTKELLKDINARLDFETGVIKVDAKIGMGRTTLFLSGNMDYKKWVPAKLSLHLNNDFPRPLRVSIPRFVDGEIALSLDITGEASSPTVKGIINVMNMSFTNWPTEGGGELGFLSHAKWDVDIVFKGNNRYYNDFIQAEVLRDSRFNFKWDGNYLLVNGRGEAERGSFIYMGVEFNIVKGSSYTVDTSMEDGKPQMRTYIDAKGIAKVERTTLTLVFSGELGKIEPVLTAEPPMPKEKIIALLSPEYANLTSQQIDELLKSQVIEILAETLEARITKPLERVVRSVLRVDVFKLRSEMIKGIIKATSSTELTPLSILTPLEGSSVEIGKYIAENLYVDYKAILQKEKVTSEWGVEYAFVRDIKMKYAFRPKEDSLKTEHEIFLEMSLRF